MVPQTTTNLTRSSRKEIEKCSICSKITTMCRTSIIMLICRTKNEKAAYIADLRCNTYDSTGENMFLDSPGAFEKD